MAWDTFVSSELLTCDANFEMFHDGTTGIVIQLTPRELLDLNFTIASEVGETDDLEIQILGGNRVVNNSVSQTITSTTVFEIADADDEAADYYMGMYALFTTGGEIKDLREISDMTTSTGTPTITVVRALSGTPSAGETVDIFHMRPISQFTIAAETALTEDLPQNSGVTVMGFPFIIARARSTAGNDAHIALMTYTKDGVSA
jgi:hypothetical protein